MEDSREFTQEQRQIIEQMSRQFTFSALQFQKFRELWAYFVSIGGVVLLINPPKLNDISLNLINQVYEQLTLYVLDDPIWKIWVRHLSIYVWEEFQKLPDVTDMYREYYQKINIINTIDPSLLVFVNLNLNIDIVSSLSDELSLYFTTHQMIDTDKQLLTKLLVLIHKQYCNIAHINVHIQPIVVELIPNTLNIMYLNKILYDRCSSCDSKKATHYISSKNVNDSFCPVCYLKKMQLLNNNIVKTYFRVMQKNDNIVWRT